MNNNAAPSTSWGSTIIQGAIILVLVIALIVILYFVFNQSQQTPYPKSPFNYGDIIQISPAVPMQSFSNPLTIAPNQYLARTNCDPSNGCPAPSGKCPGCYQPSTRLGGACPKSGCPGPGSCTLTFTGNKEEKRSKWRLKQFDTSGGCYLGQGSTGGCDGRGCDANQSLTSGFGNRFYLENLDGDESDVTNLTKFMPFNAEFNCTWSNSTTFPVIGSTDNTSYWCYSILVYFYPTTQPDLYYMLFPADVNIFGNQSIPYYNTSPNTGIMNLRPFSQPGLPTSSTYDPWNGNIPNDSGPLLDINNQETGPYPTPEIYLFKVTKLG